MKKLFNVSPFILLLAPVLMMSAFLAVSANQDNEGKSEFTLKTRTITTPVMIINQLKK